MFLILKNFNFILKALKLDIILQISFIFCLLNLAVRVLNIPQIYSATSDTIDNTSQENVADNHDKHNHDIQLDDDGLTVQLDFMNLTTKDIQVLESLFNYREKLKLQADQLVKKESELKIVETRIQQHLNEMKQLKIEINSMLEQHQQQEEKKLAQLIRIYENMKPDQAALIFNNLPEERILSLLQGMKESKSSAILSQMNPSKASYLTDKMLSQKELKD